MEKKAMFQNMLSLIIHQFRKLRLFQESIDDQIMLNQKQNSYQQNIQKRKIILIAYLEILMNQHIMYLHKSFYLLKKIISNKIELLGDGILIIQTHPVNEYSLELLREKEMIYFSMYQIPSIEAIKFLRNKINKCNMCQLNYYYSFNKQELSHINLSYYFCYLLSFTQINLHQKASQQKYFHTFLSLNEIQQI
ncbi:hypothetical protein pb186bvf_021151 [Paramecium bursaria]